MRISVDPDDIAYKGPFGPANIRVYFCGVECEKVITADSETGYLKRVKRIDFQSHEIEYEELIGEVKIIDGRTGAPYAP